VDTPISDGRLLAAAEHEATALVQFLRRWSPSRWSGTPRQQLSPVTGSAADLAHHLVQALADLAADAEGRPLRSVPRLDSPLSLPDQLAVVADDLIRAAPPPPVALRALAELVLHRAELDGGPIPPATAALLLASSPAAAPGNPDEQRALERARALCSASSPAST